MQRYTRFSISRLSFSIYCLTLSVFERRIERIRENWEKRGRGDNELWQKMSTLAVSYVYLVEIIVCLPLNIPLLRLTL